MFAQARKALSRSLGVLRRLGGSHQALANKLISAQNDNAAAKSGCIAHRERLGGVLNFLSRGCVNADRWHGQATSAGQHVQVDSATSNVLPGPACSPCGSCGPAAQRGARDVASATGAASAGSQRSSRGLAFAASVPSPSPTGSSPVIRWNILGSSPYHPNWSGFSLRRMSTICAIC